MILNRSNQTGKLVIKLTNFKYSNKLAQKYANLTRDINEEYINIHPIQRGGILTSEAYKALVAYGDGYSICDNCLKGRIDQIENPPVTSFLDDMAQFLNVDKVMLTGAAREAKRITIEVLAKKYPKRKTVVVDSNAHYTTYLAIEANGLNVREVPNSGNPEYSINPEDYQAIIEKIKKEENELPLLAVLTHVDYKYGNVNDPKPVGAICQEQGIPFLLNAAYSGGVLPIDCKDGIIDFISCSGHKSMAASGPIGLLGFKKEYADDVEVLSKIKGDLSEKSFPSKICTVMGCPPVYGAPLITLMASFPSIVKRTEISSVQEESKKINYIIDAIKNIEGVEILGKLPKIHPLTSIKTNNFAKIAKSHSRRGFFVRDEFKERGIIGMAPGISKNMKISTYGLTWNQVKRFASAFIEISERFG